MGQLAAVDLERAKVLGVESWKLSSRHVEAALTCVGGHLGPVTFKCGSKQIQPYSVAPWAEDGLDGSQPEVLRVLRGDFFCMPFGGNAKPHNGEQHPVHGEVANKPWQLVGAQQSNSELIAEFALTTSIRPGKVEKQIRLVAAHSCVYSRHTLRGFSGRMPIGHHAMLKFPDEPMSGFISTSPFVYGQVFPSAFENPALGGYQALKPGAVFKTLHEVPMIDGALADLTHYPARPGFEDLAMIVANPRHHLGWSAASFPRSGYVWFGLKDTRVLRNTVFWMSNGGRHYAPWNSRHTRVMALEETTSNFHYGVAESASDNPMARLGHPTAVDLDPDQPTVVNYITGVALTPPGFDRVAQLKPAEDQKSVTLTDNAGHTVTAAVDLTYLGL